jgi:hypothetical protein
MEDLKSYIQELVDEGIIAKDTAKHLMFLINKTEK